MSQESTADGFDFLTEEDFERIRKYNANTPNSWNLLGEPEKPPKRVRCLSCKKVFEAAWESCRAYCPDECNGSVVGREIDKETKEVECVDCGEWIEVEKHSRSGVCSDCYAERHTP